MHSGNVVMIELPYERKFDTVPEVDLQEIVDYFNMEFGLNRGDSNMYQCGNFEYLGLFEDSGFERMIWKVREKDLCATVRPFEGTYIIEMDKFSNHQEA